MHVTAGRIPIVVFVALLVLLGANQAHAVMLGDQLFKLTADDGAADDRFGTSVATSGNLAIVGAPRHDSAGMDAGAAYLFDVKTGQQLLKLTADDAMADDQFGYSVGISGGLAIVGAPWDDGVGSNSGSVYVFDVSTGNQLLKLTANDAGINESFGYSVAISANTAIVGAPYQNDPSTFEWVGAAYVIDLTTQDQLKLALDTPTTDDGLGWSVALDGNTALVGAPRSGFNYAGRAATFDLTTGDQETEFSRTPYLQFNHVGESVDLSGQRAIVGAHLAHAAGGLNAGLAFLLDATTGAQTFQLRAEDGAQGDTFGTSVGIHEDIAIISAANDDDDGDRSGSAYLFDAAAGKQLIKLTANDAAEKNAFGASVGISENVAIIGSPGTYDQVGYAGAAYIFATVPEPSTMALLSVLALIFFRVARKKQRAFES